MSRHEPAADSVSGSGCAAERTAGASMGAQPDEPRHPAHPLGGGMGRTYRRRRCDVSPDPAGLQTAEAAYGWTVWYGARRQRQSLAECRPQSAGRSAGDRGNQRSRCRSAALDGGLPLIVCRLGTGQCCWGNGCGCSVYAVSWKRGLHPTILTLVGIAVAALGSAIINLMIVHARGRRSPRIILDGGKYV